MIGYVPLSGYGYCLGFDVALVIFGPHWPAQCHLAVLRDDFDVVCVGRESTVLVDRFSNLLCDGAIRIILYTLAGLRLMKCSTSNIRPTTRAT